MSSKSDRAGGGERQRKSQARKVDGNFLGVLWNFETGGLLTRGDPGIFDSAGIPCIFSCRMGTGALEVGFRVRWCSFVCLSGLMDLGSFQLVLGRW